jgi:hypothetical protein
MTDLTDYTEQQFRDWMSQGTSTATAPDPLYISLHTSDPGESPDGSTEVSATNYSRQSVGSSGWNTQAPADFTNSDGYGFENASDVAFSTAGSSWGTISHVALWDGSSDTDNALASFALDSSRSVSDGDQVQFAATNLRFVID